MSEPAARGGEERPIPARLAGLHLRGGLFALARTELEMMADQAALDREGLADLAEVRWRTGDLLGAGEAARAHLERGGEEPVALAVAAEAAAAVGRLADARRLAERLHERVGDDLEPIFAGMPRGSVWRGGVEAAGAGPPPAAPAAGRAPLRRSPPPRPWTTGEVPPRIAVADLAAPGELLERARTALRAADPTRAAVDLAVVLRLEPGLAPAILDLLARSPRAGPSPAAAALELVRGDAYRLTGRSAEAEDAYTAAAHLAAPSPGEPAPGTGKEEL